ncbi:MAG: histidine phosphatase family protein [Oscillospiraceae bacterium]|nr:histidine phosphatase family protein [Oscillospiraceae bacterium]
MQVIFIRHGEPDYSHVERRGFIGHGLDLGPLTPDGIQQAEQAAADPRLDGIQLIVASPYTRALQTAAIISRRRDIEIAVEVDLHEWLPDTTYTTGGAAIWLEQYRALRAAESGILPDIEAFESVFSRAKAVLKRYAHYDKIAVVAHGVLIRQFTPRASLGYCGITEFAYHDGIQWPGAADMPDW